MSETLRMPPGPRGWPVVGSMPKLMQSPLAFHGELAAAGPISHARVGPFHLYLLSSPALIDELLTDKHKGCVKDAFTRTLIPLVGHGLLTAEGELWKRQRKLASAPFSPKRISSYASNMVAASERIFGSLRDGESRDFHHDAMALALEIATTNLLGVSTRREAKRVGDAVEDVLAYYVERVTTWWRLFPANFPSLGLRKFQRGKQALDEVVHGIVANCRSSNTDADDYLLARLIKARSEDGEPMDEQQLLDEAITMLLAGHETTALSLTFGAYALSKNPAVTAKLHAELTRELGGRSLTDRDLPNLPYLDAVVREILRLYPPAYAFGREVVEPFELGGYTMPVGAQVVVSTYWMHRDPKHYEDPERFVPERWLEKRSTPLPRYAYLPFGGGHRVCIGMHFAQMELALMLGTLVQQVELHVQPTFELELEPVITLRSRHGMPVRVRRRVPERAQSLPPPPKLPSFDDPSLREAAVAAGCPHAAGIKT